MKKVRNVMELNPKEFKYVLTICLFLNAIICLGQGGVYINYDINPKTYDIEEPLNLWISFLETKSDSLGAQYWNKKEIDQYGQDSYFLVENELKFGNNNDFLFLLSYAKVKILSIRKKEAYFKITSLMEFAEKEGVSNIQYIFHVYAGMEEDKLKLFNALPINKKLALSHSKVGHINYYFPKYHIFNEKLAKKQHELLVQFSKDFDVPMGEMDYFFASTNEEIQMIKGFDFLIGDNGNQVRAGKADVKNRIVYASGLSEYYPHEFIHILLNSKYKNCHQWIDEGIATYYGLSRGKDLDWHLKKIHEYIMVESNDIDFYNLFDLRTFDQTTDYKYALGGLLVEYTLKKGNHDLLFKLMNSGKTNQELYSSIENLLNIKRENLGNFIRTELNKKFN